MSQANVDDLDIFRYMKTGLIKFRQVAETAMINAEAQGARVLHWLEGEQLSAWQTQVRKRQELVSRCRDAVRQKKVFKDSTGRTPSAHQEEKELKVALAALAEAEQRLAATKKAIPALQKELEVFRGGIQGLGSALAADLPRAIAMLERLSLTLTDYVNLTSNIPSSSSEAASPSVPPAGNMHRGGESAGAAEPSRDNPSTQDPNPGGNNVTG